MFSSRSFIVSNPMFKSLIHFELIIVYGKRKWSSFILLHVAVQFSQHHLLKRLSFPHCIFLAPLSQINWPCMHGLFLGCSVSLICMSVFMPVLYCFDYYSFVISGSMMSPTLFFFLKIALDIWGLRWFRTNFRIVCSTLVKNAIGILIGIALNLQIALDSMDILTILILPSMNMEYLCIYLCHLQFFSSMFYSFQCTGLSP